MNPTNSSVRIFIQKLAYSCVCAYCANIKKVKVVDLYNASSPPHEASLWYGTVY